MKLRIQITSSTKGFPIQCSNFKLSFYIGIMRTLIIFLCLLSASAPKAQTANFETSITDAANYFNHIANETQYSIALKQFKVLSNTYPNEWLPKYYAALVQFKIALLSKNDMDNQADIAIDWINKCKQLQINDEILCAESLAYTIKMQVNPAWRWFSYKDRIYGSLQKAKKINPNNPRIYVLESSLQYNLPKVLGGGCNKALPLAKQAEKLLNLEVGKRKYLPSWGFTSINEILTNCK